MIKSLGGATHSWLHDPKYALMSVIIIAIWGGLGQQIIILIVAITNVPRVYYEAAEIDGAGGFVKLFKITVPLISPSVFFLTITGFIGSLTQFDLIYMLYNANTSKAMDSVVQSCTSTTGRRLSYRISRMPRQFQLSHCV